ncbi:unnamed protein product [Allacma fusca]|uniref:Uncharacterized protein n=1 Tax=Allacma fusca TaxID=39272 RepID=A0A8J2L486_9HEXA|nr:unnamed protein product [Allacma fusca]
MRYKTCFIAICAHCRTVYAYRNLTSLSPPKNIKYHETCKSFLPGMVKEDHGHIVTIASTAGLVGVNRLVDYCASKYAAVGFHEALSTELRGELGLSGINTTLVCPYYINTGMFDGVKSKLISILDPHDVVNDVIAGILTNQELIIIPRYVLYLIVAKYFVPANVGMKLQEVLGITGTMLGFKGRPGNVKNGLSVYFVQNETVQLSPKRTHDQEFCQNAVT